MKSAVAVFFAAFGVYLWTMPPTLPAYRDAGEMATSVHTLGVSHPPSYPLYILVGHAVNAALPLGRPAYRLTFLSELASSGCLALMYYVLSASLGVLPALGGIILLGCNTTFWSVSIVPEMYSLMLFLAWILLTLALQLRRDFRPHYWYGFAFLYGLFLGNRTELLLWTPGLFLLAAEAQPWRRLGVSGLFRWVAGSLIFGALGLSIYLYLPLRSMQGPWLDWNHPANLYNLIGSLTRRGYGGTLDLLSESYATGENFLANLQVYGRHLWSDFLGPAVILVVIGLASMYRRDSRGCGATGLMYCASGPLFLFLANMPPNPHALAIVEPHYLLSDLVLAIWAAEGLAALSRVVQSYSLARDRTRRFPSPLEGDLAKRSTTSRMVPAALISGREGQGEGEGNLAVAAAVIFLTLLPWTFGQGFNRPGGNWRRVNRRWDLTDYDWCRNVLRSVPMKPSDAAGPQTGLADGPVVIAKKDVQLFSLWYHQTVEGRRSDVHFVAQGLSASPWYQAAKRRIAEGVWAGPLRDGDEWKRFAETNGPLVFTTTDTELPQGLVLGPPSGLVAQVPALPPSPVSSLPTGGEGKKKFPSPLWGAGGVRGIDLETTWKFMERRGPPHYEDQPDFFDSDLIESYAMSRQRLGTFYADRKQWEPALRQFYMAWSMKWWFPEIAPLIGFSLFNMGRLSEAADAYRLAIQLYAETYALTQRYHSLPSLVETIQRGEAEAHLNLGVILEKLGDRNGAEGHYQDAIRLAPAYAQPHYNLAVLYWNKNWETVVREMSEFLRLDPTNAAAANYLAAARRHLSLSPTPH